MVKFNVMPVPLMIVESGYYDEATCIRNEIRDWHNVEVDQHRKDFSLFELRLVFR